MSEADELIFTETVEDFHFIFLMQYKNQINPLKMASFSCKRIVPIDSTLRHLGTSLERVNLDRIYQLSEFSILQRSLHFPFRREKYKHILAQNF